MAQNQTLPSPNERREYTLRDWNLFGREAFLYWKNETNLIIWKVFSRGRRLLIFFLSSAGHKVYIWLDLLRTGSLLLPLASMISPLGFPPLKAWITNPLIVGMTWNFILKFGWSKYLNLSTLNVFFHWSGFHSWIIKEFTFNYYW